MAAGFRPRSEAELAETVAWAAAERAPLAVHGNNSLAGLGRPVQTDHDLDLLGFAGISLYEPEELVMRAGAGTPLAEIVATLAEARQQLAFEPPELAPLYGGAAGGATIGGVFACNLSGPRRIQAGAARDHILGLRAVSGRGEVFKAGGRVVKNVSGYDLCKVLAGSYGTLAALSEVTFKVMPAPEKTRTLLAVGLDPAAGVDLLCRAAGAPLDVSGLAHVAAGPAARSAVDYVAAAGGPVTAIRIEGTAASVAARFATLKELAATATVEELHGHNSARFWREVGGATLIDDGRAVLWRISVAPTAAPGVLDRLGSKAEVVLDWSGGLIWLALTPSDDGGAGRVRAAVAEVGGHATLIRAPDAIRARVDVFQPQPAPLAGLSARLKQAFDPHGILNPGRMYPGV